MMVVLDLSVTKLRHLQFTSLELTILVRFSLQLSKELGFPIVANAQLTFTKCLEMKLQDHIEVIAKVAEIAGKEYSIEQVNCKLHIHVHSSVAL